MISVVVTLSLRLASLAQGASATPIDVTALTVGPPAAVVELDLGKLRGELRQIAWSPDGGTLYIQTAEGSSASPKLRHYTVPVTGGSVVSTERPPDWAPVFWAYKSDRAAPGIGSLLIDFEQKYETLKVGTGQSGALDREAGAAGGNGGNLGNIDSISKANDQNQKQLVARLTLYGEAISEFVNETPVPGLMFSWGPEKSATIAFTDRDGRLFLLDQKKHKRAIAGAKDALLPAWSMEGSRLAWVQKSGRRKFTLMYATVSD